MGGFVVPGCTIAGMTLTEQDKQTISRAQTLAGLGTPEAVKEYTGIADDFRACAAALAEAQELLTAVAAIVSRGEVLA